MNKKECDKFLKELCKKHFNFIKPIGVTIEEFHKGEEKVYGFYHYNRIYLNSSYWCRFTKQEKLLILTHEFAHHVARLYEFLDFTVNPKSHSDVNSHGKHWHFIMKNLGIKKPQRYMCGSIHKHRTWKKDYKLHRAKTQLGLT